MLSKHREEEENLQEEEASAWRSLAETLDKLDPLLKNTLFLQGYEYCSNMYLLVGDYLTIVDPGNDYTALMELFRLPQFAPEDIRKIVLTHGHPDHAMGALELFRYPSVRSNPQLEVILHAEGPAELKRIVGQFGAVLTELRGGEVLDLSGYDWTVIATPGHTGDCICLHHVESRTLLSGDTVLTDAMAAPDPHAGGSMGRYLASLRGLVRLNVETVLPGHGLPVASGGRQVVEDSYRALMHKLLDLPPNVPWFKIASAAYGRGLPHEALFCCDKALAEGAGDAGLLSLKGFSLNDLERYSEALDLFDRLIGSLSSTGDAAVARMGKGLAFLGLNRYEESIGCFDEVLTSQPGRKDALLYKALALYLSGNVEEALKIEHFKADFIDRYKTEILKLQHASKTRSEEKL